MIMGDFNSPVMAYDAQKLWHDAGWRELQDELYHRHGIPPRPTCKSSTRADQIWASPELLRYFRDIGFCDLFPDHLLYVGAFDVPKIEELERYWQMPERLPWHDVDRASLESTFTSAEPFAWSEASTEDYKLWCKRFETKVSKSVKDSISFHDRSRGRGQVLQPRSRPSQLGVPKGSREGEPLVLDSLLGRSAQLWFQQMRRFQSLRHSIKASNVHQDAIEHRRGTWQAIVRAKGFRGGFPSWWNSRKIKTQGADFELPLQIPPPCTFELIFLDYQKNYQGYLQWQRAQKQRVIDAKWRDKADSCFQVVKPDRKKPLDSVVDEVEQVIEVVDGTRQLVSVPGLFPDEGCLAWTLNGFPARVRREGEHYEIDSDLLLVSGQKLKCKVFVSDTDEIHARLLALWNSRWGKHQQTSLEQWPQIAQFARDKITGPQCALPAPTYEVWIQAIKGYKTTSARGPDGWGQEDLLHMPRACAEELLALLARVESSANWPLQLQQALVHCLEKSNDATSVNQYRPITLMSLVYRVWAGVHSSRILRHLSQLCDGLQCGFVEGGTASDIWYWVQTAIEAALSDGKIACGIVGDLVKAYNTLPREPVWHFLQLLGIPSQFIHCWRQHLQGLQRRFVVRNSCSEVASTRTGFPEGCPLSCAGMVALDIVWHAFQKHYSPAIRCLSFVDNLEIYGDRVGPVLQGLSTMQRFCQLLDLELDMKKLYGWSTSQFGRKALVNAGVTISHGERDLGGQMNYGSKLHNQVVVDRIQSLKSLFTALRKASLTVQQKMKCISGALWPRGLHGCESVELGEAHFKSLRSDVMRALRWDRAGASPVIRLGLVHPLRLDPGFYQWWRSVSLFRRQCERRYEIRQHWREFVNSLTQRKTHGPFTKLCALFSAVHWVLDQDFMLLLPEGFSVAFLQISLESLKRIALYHWQQLQAQQASHRRDTHDLVGFDPTHFDLIDPHCTAAEQETLNVVRDGSFFTQDIIAKFAKGPGLCPLCPVEDTREHRYLFCPNYEAARAECPALQNGAPGISSALALHGLPGANPYNGVFWQTLQALTLLPTKFVLAPPATGVWHVFTDGSGRNVSHPTLMLTSWAIYLADEGGIAAGWVPGLDQTVPRAELWAILQALLWIGDAEGELHLWSDCQHVVELFRTLLIEDHLPSDLANSDLWDDIRIVLFQKRCLVYVHKVASHIDERTATSPLEEWAFLNNARVDLMAQTINHTRPAWFMNVYDRYSAWWHQVHHDLESISAFHLAVARIDMNWQDATIGGEDLGEPSFPERSWQDVVGAFSLGVDDRLLGWQSHVQGAQEFGVPFIERLISWVLGLEQTAGQEGYVSYLELYFGFRLHCGCSLFQLIEGGGHNPYLHQTVAGELRIFKKAFRGLCTALQCGEHRGWVDLSNFGVFVGTEGVRCAWPVDVETKVLSQIVQFVRNRPIRNSQALARPF